MQIILLLSEMKNAYRPVLEMGWYVSVYHTGTYFCSWISYRHLSIYGSRVSSGSIVSWLRAGRSGFDPRQGQKDFSSILCVQTGSGAHPASSPMGTGGPFTGGKARPGRDADHSPPSSAEVVNE
jgi:hypothetical protein